MLRMFLHQVFKVPDVTDHIQKSIKLGVGQFAVQVFMAFYEFSSILHQGIDGTRDFDAPGFLLRKFMHGSSLR